MRFVGKLEFWTCSDERETGVQWRPFPGFYIDILRHDREQGCVPDPWAFGSKSDGGLLLQQGKNSCGKQLNSSTKSQPNSAPAGC